MQFRILSLATAFALASLLFASVAKAADAEPPKADETKAASPKSQPVTQPLWKDGAPDAKGKEDKDIPTITIYQPESSKSTRASVLVCPGGGYGGLALDHEGKQVAEWLNGLGLTAIVLEYRLGPRYHHPVMLEDVGHAIRTVRHRAKE